MQKSKTDFSTIEPLCGFSVTWMMISVLSSPTTHNHRCCCLEVDLIIMKLYTALIIASIAPVSGAFDVAAIPEFVETSSEQIVCDEQVRSTQPYYCFGSEYQDCDCWQE